MKVILLKDVKGVGKRFEEKQVTNGHAANFLIPRGLVLPLSAANVAQVKALREAEEKKREKERVALKESVAALAGRVMKIQVAADEEGHLFEKITAAKLGRIAHVDPELIVLDTPIKTIGTFEVPIAVGEDKETHFTLEVERA